MRSQSMPRSVVGDPAARPRRARRPRRPSPAAARALGPRRCVSAAGCRPPRSASSSSSRGPGGARVGDRRDLDAGSLQRERGLEPPVGRRRDHRPAARASRRRASRAARRRSRASRPGGRCPRTSAAARSSRSRRRGCRRGSGAACSRTRRGRSRRRTRARRPERAPRPRRPAPGRRAPATRRRRSPASSAAAELGTVVDQDHVRPELGRSQRGAHPGDATADHEHVGVAAAVLRAPLAVAPGGAPACPRPAAWRRTFSYSGQSRRGRMKVL